MKRLLFLTLFLIGTTAIKAQDGFIGEIRLFAGNYPPRGWAFCNGQAMTVQQNAALFSILGCTYGGDCRTTFNLPDLRGRVPVGAGQGNNLTFHPLGQQWGHETVALTMSNSPVAIVPPVKVETSEDGTPISGAGPGMSQPFLVSPPSLGLNYIICLQGLYPVRE